MYVIIAFGMDRYTKSMQSFIGVYMQSMDLQTNIYNILMH